MVMEEKILFGLLNKLTDRRGFSWKIHCIYTNGIDEPIREILIYHDPQSRVRGRIAFGGNTGYVVNCRYPGLIHRNRPENIFDLLLDAINLENARCHTA